ncbi:MAG: alkaline phosphatase family protein [Planctomycetota bacterium]|jgi:predicted AlkP superfamily phosphohydrolase/phosphomutase
MSYRKRQLNRREFLRDSTIAAATFAAGLGGKTVYGAKDKRAFADVRKKVIVLGIDGMDPDLSERMMDAGLLPNFDRLRKMGGYQRLGTSIPPQSPVAWANFITGANPGTHGIYSFVHREPENPCKMINSISHTTGGLGFPLGKHLLLLRQPRRVLGRQGVPFWDYLDEAGVSSAVYLVPSDYPPSRSKYGNHRSLSGMGTPDLMGSVHTYQYFTEDGPSEPKEERNGVHCRVVFRDGTAGAELFGPRNHFLKEPKRSAIGFSIHKDVQNKSCVIEVQGQTILLREKQWSEWVELDFIFDVPFFIPNKQVNGICQMYLKELAPTFRLYISPISIKPAEPAMQISEPDDFAAEISEEIGQFCTVGFQEAFKARNNNVLTDAEYAQQADMVLESRLKLLDYALGHYKAGLLFFYFSSADLQSHIFWWDTDKKNPVRSPSEAIKYHKHIKEVYKKMDNVLGRLLKSYGDRATIIALSDHGFSYFSKYFSVNVWLKKNGYIRPSHCTSMCPGKNSSEVGVDWFTTRAYGVGVDSVYLNLKGREPYGTVRPEERDVLLKELVAKLEAVRDVDGNAVISRVYRSDEVYSGSAMKYAPDLILGFHRGYRGPGLDSEGRLAKEVMVDNTEAWGADHCFAAEEVPGVLFANRRILAKAPSLIDLAPTMLAEFGLGKPNTMEGSNVFAL